jgi:DNA (cytosine-5)-methyltransferase 1
MGYHRVGFEVVGVDIELQPHYPFEFHQADALTFPLEGFAAIHASPPCQGYTTMSNRWGSDSPLLIDVIRARMDRPYLLENVQGARRHLISPVELTGEMFGLRVHRPRLFELGGWTALIPPRPRRQVDPVAVYGKLDGRRLWTRQDGTELRVADLETGSAAMGIDWMTWDELREAIPPAYTEYLGAQLLAALDRAA